MTSHETAPLWRLGWRLLLGFGESGYAHVEARAINAPTVFADFDDYWSPFLGGQGPGGVYVRSLDDARRDALRDRLRGALARELDGTIHLSARAWAVKGRR